MNTAAAFPDDELDAAIDLDVTTHDALIVADDYGRLIARADTLERLQLVKDGLDEAIGALLAQEQILIRHREILQIQQKVSR